jgi:hypothetical protein
VIAGHDVDAGQRYHAVLQAAAMTAALGLELLEDGVIDLGRLPDQYRRATSTVKTGTARLVLHKWREVSQSTNLADLDRLSQLSPADFVGVE